MKQGVMKMAKATGVSAVENTNSLASLFENYDILKKDANPIVEKVVIGVDPIQKTIERLKKEITEHLKALDDGSVVRGARKLTGDIPAMPNRVQVVFQGGAQGRLPIFHPSLGFIREAVSVERSQEKTYFKGLLKLVETPEYRKQLEIAHKEFKANRTTTPKAKRTAFWQSAGQSVNVDVKSLSEDEFSAFKAKWNAGGYRTKHDADGVVVE